MENLDILMRLDVVAEILRRLGLRRIVRWSRKIFESILGDTLRIEWEGLILTGAIEHRYYLQALREGRAEPGTMALVRKLVPQGGIVVDVGAYIGFYTLLAAKLVGPVGRVYAFEPNPQSCAILRRNIRLNRFEEMVQVFEACVLDFSGQVKFYLDYDGIQSSIVRLVPHTREVTLSCVTLDEVLGDVRAVNLMKIDVEGAEARVLLGAKDLIHRSPDLWLICEVYPAALTAGGSSLDELLRIIEDFGFMACAIDEDAMRLQPIPTNWPRAINIIAHRGSGERARSVNDLCEL